MHNDTDLRQFLNEWGDTLKYASTHRNKGGDPAAEHEEIPIDELTTVDQVRIEIAEGLHRAAREYQQPPATPSALEALQARRALYEGVWGDIDELLSHAIDNLNPDDYRQGHKDALRKIRDKWLDRWRDFSAALAASSDAPKEQEVLMQLWQDCADIVAGGAKVPAEKYNPSFVYGYVSGTLKKLNIGMCGHVSADTPTTEPVEFDDLDECKCTHIGRSHKKVPTKSTCLAVVGRDMGGKLYCKCKKFQPTDQPGNTEVT